MFKFMFLFLVWLPLNSENKTLSTTACTCPPVSNLQTPGQAANPYTLSWQGHTSAVSYKVYFTREGDEYTSPVYSTTSPSYPFYNLPEGHYNFFVAAVCASEMSGFIGVEDYIEN